MENQQFEYADFGRRAVALIIDMLLYVPLSVFINIVTLQLVAPFFEGAANISISDYLTAKAPMEILNIVSLFSQIFWCATVAWFFSHKWQATPGKRIMSVYVINKDGSKVVFGKAFVRTFLPVAFISLLNFLAVMINNPESEIFGPMSVELKSFILPVLFLLFVAVWYLIAAFTKEKTAMHDLIVGTRVLKGKVGN
jgi:uncharacterized RDD family membrane protein YckC